MSERQPDPKLGHGGVVVNQLLEDRLRARNSASAGRPVSASKTPRLMYVCPRLLRNPVTAGYLSARSPWIASALRYSASPSRGRPVFASRRPRLTWVFARVLR